MISLSKTPIEQSKLKSGIIKWFLYHLIAWHMGTSHFHRHFLFISWAVALLFNWKYFGGWNLSANNVWTMCGWHADDMWVRFGARFHWQMMYVIRTSSAHAYVIRTLAWVAQFHAVLHLVSCTCHPQTRTSSAHHPYVIHTPSPDAHVICILSADAHIISNSPHGPQLYFLFQRY